MTVKEATKIVRNVCDTYIEDHCKFGGEGYKPFLIVCNMATEALQKQEPKTPIYQGDGYVDGYPIVNVWHCPSCDRQYEISERYKYCPRCGQRIDWKGYGENER